MQARVTRSGVTSSKMTISARLVRAPLNANVFRKLFGRFLAAIASSSMSEGFKWILLSRFLVKMFYSALIPAGTLQTSSVNAGPKSNLRFAYVLRHILSDDATG